MASPMPPTPPFDVWRMPFWTTLESFWHILGSVWCMLMSFCQFWRHLGCQSGAKRRSWGTWWAPGSPKGYQGALWEPKGAILVDLGVIWGHFGIIWGAKLEPKVGLEAPGGPPGSPKGSQGASWEPNGAILVDFGVILGSFVKSKSCPSRCHNSEFFRMWILSDFGVLRGAYVWRCLSFFRGLQRQTAKTLDM